MAQDLQTALQITMVGYPKCSTCKKAESWLKDHDITFVYRDIKEDKPTREEIQTWHEASGLELKRFFNTSGKIYREQNIKDKLKDLSTEQQYELLATDGMLVKRPILITEQGVRTGFKEEEWKEILPL